MEQKAGYRNNKRNKECKITNFNNYLIKVYLEYISRKEDQLRYFNWKHNLN